MIPQEAFVRCFMASMVSTPELKVFFWILEIDWSEPIEWLVSLVSWGITDPYRSNNWWFLYFRHDVIQKFLARKNPPFFNVLGCHWVMARSSMMISFWATIVNGHGSWRWNHSFTTNWTNRYGNRGWLESYSLWNITTINHDSWPVPTQRWRRGSAGYLSRPHATMPRYDGVKAHWLSGAVMRWWAKWWSVNGLWLIANGSLMITG